MRMSFGSLVDAGGTYGLLFLGLGRLLMMKRPNW